MSNNKDTTFGRGAAAITLFAGLVAVEYADKDYDGWDLVVAIAVLFVFRTNWETIKFDKVTTIISCWGVGVAVAILCGFCLTHLLGLEDWLDVKILTADLTLFISIVSALLCYPWFNQFQKV